MESTDWDIVIERAPSPWLCCCSKVYINIYYVNDFCHFDNEVFSWYLGMVGIEEIWGLGFGFALIRVGRLDDFNYPFLF